VARNEERDCSFCSKVSGVSASEGRTSEDGWTPSTLTDFRVEVGAHHYGFRHCTAPQSKREQCSIGYSRPPHEVSSLFPIQTGAVNRVTIKEVSAGGGSTAWCANQHRVRQRYQISISLLEKSSREPGDTTKV